MSWRSGTGIDDGADLPAVICLSITKLTLFWKTIHLGTLANFFFISKMKH